MFLLLLLLLLLLVLVVEVLLVLVLGLRGVMVSNRERRSRLYWGWWGGGGVRLGGKLLLELGGRRRSRPAGVLSALREKAWRRVLIGLAT